MNKRLLNISVAVIVIGLALYAVQFFDILGFVRAMHQR